MITVIGLGIFSSAASASAAKGGNDIEDNIDQKGKSHQKRVNQTNKIMENRLKTRAIQTRTIMQVQAMKTRAIQTRTIMQVQAMKTRETQIKTMKTRETQIKTITQIQTTKTRMKTPKTIIIAK